MTFDQWLENNPELAKILDNNKTLKKEVHKAYDSYGLSPKNEITFRPNVQNNYEINIKPAMSPTPPSNRTAALKECSYNINTKLEMTLCIKNKYAQKVEQQLKLTMALPPLAPTPRPDSPFSS